MKRYLLLCTLVAAALTASAEEFWYGQGDGQTMSKSTQGKSNTLTLTAAIKIPAAQVANYVGGQITAIEFAVAKDVTDATYFISDHLGDVSQQTVAEGGLTKGWHHIDLATPYQFTEAKDIYIGYTTLGKSQTLSVEKGNGREGSCITGEGNDYVDQFLDADKDWSLNVRALLSVPDPQPAGVGFTSLRDLVIDHDGPTTLRGYITSTSSQPVTSYSFRVLFDGEVIDTQSATCDLRQRGDVTPYTLTLPAIERGVHTYAMELITVNGQAPVHPFRYTAQAKRLILFPRRQVMEEATGTWCGFCPRGAVAMSFMREQYPDSFIGIAVHASSGQARDAHQISSYMPLLSMVSSFPSAFMNRAVSFDPDPATVESVFQAQSAMAEQQVIITEARYTDQTHRQLSIQTRCRFGRDSEHEGYGLSFVVLEDHVQDVQANYYSGGSFGSMGGFENQGEYVLMDLMDVARHVEGYAGIEGSVPTTLVAGEEYDFTYVLDLPSNILDLKNISLVALLVSAGGKQILNADKCENLLEPTDEGIEAVRPDVAPSTSATFSLQGHRQVNPQAPGIYIRDGKKFLVK